MPVARLGGWIARRLVFFCGPHKTNALLPRGPHPHSRYNHCPISTIWCTTVYCCGWCSSTSSLIEIAPPTCRPRMLMVWTYIVRRRSPSVGGGQKHHSQNQQQQIWGSSLKNVCQRFSRAYDVAFFNSIVIGRKLYQFLMMWICCSSYIHTYLTMLYIIARVNIGGL